ncbi:MAG: hypothetical protein A2381_04350 [Bdellovibrionales bacterium RIFOXYB1_FULL_37_110]|nr:MAG: hypothetical protein A2181_09575 [Bdellovibrionales bacterium RIFOXYA1_FULL_38_20]OFZ46620.1 MAG: hypothetical protein A2417_04635 [Bdellovibrionales bacterium RIFOXYC1_FULL_37_79]OFZ57474.1 MAG: hypothetical protein A2381_04350 [Bdellovibrionales bacterium RIFOXYB1_FULL_37_110]OFZ64559.1 MAG: hypothetical protein A2577_13825 [Bdellovibrionales bacterium RIFOXYD1_FULL_36_51]
MRLTKLILILLLLLVSINNLYAISKTICGGVDDRVLYDDQKMARLHNGPLGKHGCTATLISDRCLISAGHCENFFKVLEFNVPLSNWDGSINHAKGQDTYLIDPKSIVLGGVAGNDWAVMKALKHHETDYYPGEIYGFYKVSFLVKANDNISIAGYGQSRFKEHNNVLKIASGVIGKIEVFRLYYQVDTTSGDSGAVIINQRKEIVGIHTLGGCNNDYNKGIFIGANPELMDAISKCVSE